MKPNPNPEIPACAAQSDAAAGSRNPKPIGASKSETTKRSVRPVGNRPSSLVNWKLPLLVAWSLAAGLSFALAGDTLWQASSGLKPDQINPPWDSYVEVSAPPPYLTNGALHIEVEHGGIHLYEYYAQLGGHPSLPLAMPTRLVIEARMRLVNGTSNHVARAPAAIVFVTSPGVGCALNIDHDEIFLYSAGAGHGPSTNVDTKLNPHTYRIEVAGLSAGSAVTVFYDGQRVLTGTTFYDLYLNGDRPQISWGDITEFEWGASDWYSFYHNALAPVPGERVLYGGIGDHLITLNLTNGMAADLGALAGIPSGHYIRTLVPSPDGHLFATIEPSSGYNPSLSKINPATRAATVMGQIAVGGTNVVWLEGLAYNVLERQLYGSVSLTGSGSESPVLVTINPTNAAATVICTVTNGSGRLVDMDSIAFFDSGEMVGFDVFYAGAGTYYTEAYDVDQSRSLGSGGFILAYAAVAGPALDRQTGRWYFGVYDARMLASGNIAYEGLNGPSYPTHSTADFSGYRLLGLAFPYDYAHPYLRLSIQPGVQIGWPTLANWNYQLQARGHLTSGTWTNVGNPIPGDGQTKWVPDPAGAGQKFYRVRVNE